MHTPSLKWHHRSMIHDEIAGDYRFAAVDDQLVMVEDTSDFTDKLWKSSDQYARSTTREARRQLTES
jgi:hypothetical protein